MLTKLASLMNFTCVIVDDTVVAEKNGATVTVFHDEFQRLAQIWRRRRRTQREDNINK